MAGVRTKLPFDLKRHTSRASPDRRVAIHPWSGALYDSQVHLPSELSAYDNQIASPGGGLAMHGAFGLIPCREAE